MTIAEFKAWLEGYEASFVDGGRPDLSQWEVVKEKLATVSEFPLLSYPLYDPTFTSATIGSIPSPPPMPVRCENMVTTGTYEQ